MTEPTDPRMAFVLMVKEHIQNPVVQSISKVLVADQYADFWLAPFSHGSSRWDNKGGLVEAMLLGYRAFSFLVATAEHLFTKVDKDRLLAIYMIILVSRWANIRTKQVTFQRMNPCSATSVAVANAATFGLDLTPAEAQALTRWYSSRSELIKDHEGFTPEWWVISETMNWIFIANRQ